MDPEDDDGEEARGHQQLDEGRNLARQRPRQPETGQLRQRDSGERAEDAADYADLLFVLIIISKNQIQN